MVGNGKAHQRGGDPVSAFPCHWQGLADHIAPAILLDQAWLAAFSCLALIYESGVEDTKDTASTDTLPLVDKKLDK